MRGRQRSYKAKINDAGVKQLRAFLPDVQITR
jgi:hypothetical protein